MKALSIKGKYEARGMQPAMAVTSTPLHHALGYEWLKYAFLFLLISMVFWTGDAHAQNLLPSGDANLQIPGTSSGDSWIKQFAYAFIFIIILLGLIALGFGIINGIWRLFMVSDDARTQDEGIMNVVKKVGGIVLIIVVCIALFMVVNTVVIDPLYKMFS